MTKDKDIKTVVPSLRFPEFRDTEGWKIVELNKACTINPITKELPDSFVYIDLESVQDGKLLQKKIIEKYSAPSRAQRLLNKGDIIYQTVRPYQKNNYFFTLEDGVDYVASTGYAQLRAFQSNSYIYQYIHTEEFVSRVIEKCTGSNYPAINSSDLSEIILPIPNISEQEKIADCLDSLGDLISAVADKIEALKEYKKGLIQQLFPVEGKTTPILRFPEFQNTPEWKETTLGEEVYYENGKAHENDIDESGQYIVVNSKFISTDGEVVKYTDNPCCLAEDGDILMVLSDVPNGRAIAKCFIVDYNDKYTVNQRICKLTPKRVVGLLLYYIINRNPFLLAFDDGIKQTNIKKDDVLNCPFRLPKDPTEQQKIADCLLSVDKLISAETDKLDQLKAHKKGLMQQLFPIINE